MSLDWDPAQYERFAAERIRPAYDLLALVQPVPGAAAIDLGCGTGEITVALHRRLAAATTIGVDSSAAMVQRAKALEGEGVMFRLGDLVDAIGDGPYDVAFANASLHWVPDHGALFARLFSALRPGGQLAVQVPANADHASHLVAAEIGAEEPFATALAGIDVADPVQRLLSPQGYSELLHRLGFSEQTVRLQVYGHVLDRTDDVVEWVKGTTLLRFQSHMTPEMFDDFLERYRERLLERLGSHSPYFYAFKRILLWARRD